MNVLPSSFDGRTNWETLFLLTASAKLTNGKGAYAGHDVAYCIAFFEHCYKSTMLRIEPGVPVDLCVVELEGAVLLTDHHVEVVGASKDFIFESAEFVLFANVVDFVDYRLYARVLIHENFGDEILVLEVLIAEVEMGDMADLRLRILCRNELLGDQVGDGWRQAHRSPPCVRASRQHTSSPSAQELSIFASFKLPTNFGNVFIFEHSGCFERHNFLKFGTIQGTHTTMDRCAEHVFRHQTRSEPDVTGLSTKSPIPPNPLSASPGGPP
ncbi:hypothetical protein KC322_g58 [Hortaea werneckii]|nr:hypothetical protein KC322_g58 [Hortaea werneckii]